MGLLPFGREWLARCKLLAQQKGGKDMPGAMSQVKVKVVYQKGVCSWGHKLGDEWVVGNTTPAGICNATYAMLYPHIHGLQQGGQYEYPKSSGVSRFGCPDAWNVVVFELSVVPGSSQYYGNKLPPGSGCLETLK